MADQPSTTEPTTPPPPEGEGTPPPTGQGDPGAGGGEGEGEGDEFKSPESKQAVLADLASERDRRQQLETELQQYRTAQQEAERAAMDEVERARAEGRDEGREAGNAALRRAAVMVAASDPAHPFHSPDEAAELLREKLAGVAVTDDGQVDQAQVQTLVAELAEQRPHLVRTATGRTPAPADLNGGEGGGTPPGEPRDADSWNASLRRQFTRSG